MHFVASLGNLWQVCCGGWLWYFGYDAGILGVGDVGVAVYHPSFWAVVCAMIFFQFVVNVVAWGSWGAVAVLVVVLLGFWCS